MSWLKELGVEIVGGVTAGVILLAFTFIFRRALKRRGNKSCDIKQFTYINQQNFFIVNSRTADVKVDLNPYGIRIIGECDDEVSE